MYTLSLHRTRLFAMLLTPVLLLIALGVTGCGSDSPGGTDPDPTAPPPPAGFSGTSGDAQVALEWNAVSDAEAYTVYRATESFSSVDEASPVGEGLSATDFTDTDVSNGMLYYYRVTATANDLESRVSNQIDVTPFAAPDRPPSVVTR